MLKFIILAIVVFIVVYLWSNKIIFRFDTIFRKGFKRIPDEYRGLYMDWKATETERHCPF